MEVQIMKKRLLLGTGLVAGALLTMMTMNVFASQITEERAKSIALENAGIKAEDVSYIWTEIEREDHKLVYDVEFLTKDHKEYDYEISAADGTILSIDCKIINTAEAVQNTTNLNQAAFSLEQAKQIALTHTGQQAENVTLTKSNTKYDDGLLIYKLEFYTADSKEYEYKINAATGTILSADYEVKNPASFIQNAANSSQAAFSLEQAKEIALSHAGQQASNAAFVKIQTEYDDGRLIHEVEFYSPDYKKYEYKVDSNTGEIISWKFDVKNYTPVIQNNSSLGVIPPLANQTKAAVSAAITLEDAKAAALKNAGLTTANVIWGKVKSDYDDGRLIYEGEFFYNNLEYEFEIDAATGMLLDWDVESIFD